MRGSRAALLLHLRARFAQRHEVVLRCLLRLRRLEQDDVVDEVFSSQGYAKLSTGAIKVLPFFA